MPYFKTIWVCGRTIEVHKGYSKRVQKHESRNPREQLTPEEVEKINEKNAENRLRRLLNANFKGNDYHLQMTYKKENRVPP